MLIEPKITRAPYYYYLTSANRTIMGNKVVEFVQKKIVRFEILENGLAHKKISLLLLSQKMEGTALLHQWMADMDELQSHIIAITNTAGRLTGIENFASLQHQWHNGFREKMMDKYKSHQPGLATLLGQTDALLQDREKYGSHFTGYSSYRFFLQGYYGQHTSVATYPLLLNQYFGTIDLPLTVTTHCTTGFPPATYSIHLKNTALADNEKFGYKQFSALLKILTGLPDTLTTLQTDMEENLYFDKNRYLQSGNLYLQTAANNFYSVANAHTLLQLTEKEKDEMIQHLSKA